MKVLFTADIHIKLGQKNVPIDWAKARYRSLFLEIHNASRNCDLTIIGGDIFDKLPNMEELELYFELVGSIESEAIIYSGNHEALKKNTTFLSSLKNATNKVNWQVEVLDEELTYSGIQFIPYNKLKDSKYERQATILCTHVRGEIPPHVKPEIDLSLLEKWDLVLAGDLHSYSNSQRNILYPGSPITTSFHRVKVDTGFIILDTETLEHTWQKLDLPQMLKKTIKAGEPMPKGDKDLIVYEVEGDMAELAGVVGSESVSKKLVRKDSDTALILDPEMSVAQEVEEYLRYILALNEDSIANVLKELRAYV